MGFLIALSAIPGVITALFGGILIDRIGISLVAFVAGILIFLGSIGLVVGPLLYNYPFTIVARFIYGCVHCYF
jgi:hypothetical protein